MEYLSLVQLYLGEDLQFLLKYYFFNEWETEFRINTPFLDCNIARMITVFIDDFNRWVLYILTNRIYFIALWIVKIFHNVREQIFNTFAFT